MEPYVGVFFKIKTLNNIIQLKKRRKKFSYAVCVNKTLWNKNLEFNF